MSDNTQNVTDMNFADMSPEELVKVLENSELTDEQRQQISVEMIKNIGIKVAITNLLTTTRYVGMTKRIKCVVEEDGEMYMFELKKIADTFPEKGLREHDKDISKTINVTIDTYE